MNELNEFEQWMFKRFKDRIKRQLTFGGHFDYFLMTDETFKLTVTKDKDDHPDSGFYYWNFSFNGYAASVWHMKKWQTSEYEWLWSSEIDKASDSICRRLVINAFKYANGKHFKQTQPEKPPVYEIKSTQNPENIIRTIEG